MEPTEPKIMRPEMMIDIETLGKRPGCVLASVAALLFDKDGNVVETFETGINLPGQTDKGLHIDADTLIWWLKQPEAARNETFLSDDAMELGAALTKLSYFYRAAKPQTVWAHSPSFDIVILEAAFDAYRIPSPFSYRDVRDTRTLFAEAGLEFSRFAGGAAHTAHDDAYRQIEAVVKARDMLRGAA